jgi:Cys-rich repeat protein
MMRSTLIASALLIACCHEHDCDDAAGPRDRGRGGPAGFHHRDDRDHDDDHDHASERCAERDPPDADAATAEQDASALPGDGAATADLGAADAGGGCRLDRDCAAAGAGLVCDARSGACVAPSQCASDATCASGERCLAGRCLGPSAVCQFATDCAGGRDCVDGRCLSACGPQAACDPTLTCVAGYCDRPTQAGTSCAVAADCAAGSVCADGRCVAACGAARPCGAAEVCVLGFCQVDTAPRSFCARDADCASGSVCRRGSCRAACPGGTTAECLRVDVAFDTCGSDLLCTNPLELRPECARSADCPASAVCVNARCR